MPCRTINQRDGSRLPLIALLLLVTVAALSLSANAFNLENRLPLIKYGAAGSYFGYSVAEHVESEDKNIKWWVPSKEFIRNGVKSGVRRVILKGLPWDNWNTHLSYQSPSSTGERKAVCVDIQTKMIVDRGVYAVIKPPPYVFILNTNNSIKRSRREVAYRVRYQKVLCISIPVELITKHSGDNWQRTGGTRSSHLVSYW